MKILKFKINAEQFQFYHLLAAKPKQIVQPLQAPTYIFTCLKKIKKKIKPTTTLKRAFRDWYMYTAQ